MSRYPLLPLGLLLAAATFARCQSSAQMSRIDRNRDIYEKWSIDTRQAVLEGKVEEGMSPDMVWISIGEPTEIVVRTGEKKSGEDEVWVYKTGGETMDPTMGGMGGMGGSGAGFPGTYSGGGGYPGSGSGGGVVIGRGGVAVIPPSIGIGIPIGGGGGGGISVGGGGGIGGGGGMGMPRQPVYEREIVFKNGVVVRADPPPEKP
ncbi:MAG: hypothetical protein RLZZ15_1613 [Verrucomicrobiota bacterium]|jgi:hypothetical protein